LKTTGKASFVGEVLWSKRSISVNINGDGVDENSFHIQNLYATYAATEKLSFTAGFMGTFISMK
jgi:hypothetical protein